MRKIILYCLVIIMCKNITAQNVGIGTGSPQSSAALDITSSNKGLLIPRMTTTLRKAIPSPAVGLLVFDTDKSALYLFDGVSWNPFAYALNSKLPATERIPDDVVAGEKFGSAVAIDGDYAIAGAPLDDVNGNSNQGSAYIYFRNNGNWEQQAKLVAADGLAADEFGHSVAISGNYAIVGVPKDDISLVANRGCAYIFIRNGATWTQQAKLTTSDGEANDQFGFSVAILGNSAIVGAPYTNQGFAGTLPAGSVYSFKRTGTAWAAEPKFTKYFTQCANEEFGFSLAIDGSTVLVGAPGGTACGSESYTGQVFACTYNGTNWEVQHRLAPSDGETGDRFGKAVSISGIYAFIGAPQHDETGAANAGRYYFYRFISPNWQQLAPTQPTRAAGDQLGFAAAISGNISLVGQVNYAGNSTAEGAVNMYDVGISSVSLLNQLEGVNPTISSNFGQAVGISGKNIIIGSDNKITFLNVE